MNKKSFYENKRKPISRSSEDSMYAGPFEEIFGNNESKVA